MLTSSTRLRLLTSVRTVLLIGSIVFLARVQQDSASRPTNEEDRAQKKSLSVSLSAKASGRWEPALPANETQASTPEMHNGVTSDQSPKQSNVNLQASVIAVHEETDAKLHEMIAQIDAKLQDPKLDQMVDAATREKNDKADSEENDKDNSRDESLLQSVSEGNPDPPAAPQRQPTVGNFSGKVAEARRLHQEKVAADTVGDPTVHCSDDADAKCEAAVSVFMMRWIEFSDLKEAFTGDIMYIVKWTDKRMDSVVPQGFEYITMNQATAKKRIWVPEIDIINRAVGGQDDLFYAVKVQRDGECTLVRRVIATVAVKIDFTAYPFDHLTLDVALGSPTLFLGDLDLKVGSDMAAGTDTPPVSGSLFGSHRFKLEQWEIHEHEPPSPFSTSKDLRWSRIVLTMHMKRAWWRVFEMSVVPELFMLGVGYLVVWYPRIPQFIGVKSGGLMIALLTMMSCKIATSNRLPNGRAGTCWLEGFEDAAMYLIGVMLWLNVYAEIVYHKWEQPELAERISYCLKCTYPVLCFVCLGTCWWFVGTNSTSLNDRTAWSWLLRGSVAKMQAINRFWLIAFFLVFAWYWQNESATLKAHASKRRLEADDNESADDKKDDKKDDKLEDKKDNMEEDKDHDDM